MPGYITSMERMGIEKGIKQGIEQGIGQGIGQGIEQGERKLLKLLLQQKFGKLANVMTDTIDHATISEIERLFTMALRANKIEELLESCMPIEC